MSTTDQEWWWQESGEYVLDTLSDVDRVVFEKVMDHNEEVVAMVDAWRDQLQPLLDAQEAITPPAHVWENIENELFDFENTLELDDNSGLTDQTTNHIEAKPTDIISDTHDSKGKPSLYPAPSVSQHTKLRYQLHRRNSIQSA